MPGLEHFYLAGGSALTAHLGHRQSDDLDLFSVSADVDLEVVQRAITTRDRDAVVVDVSDVSLRLRIAGIPVDIVRYPYAPLDRPRPTAGGFPVASLRDVAVMKLAAIARRGLKRDFWDLHEILSAGLTLRAATNAYRRRFRRTHSDLYAVLRALTFFDDAEADPAFPRGLTRKHWEAIKRYFRAEAPKILRAR
ncbi:MAG: nucleotidyl transferase AbiEii/AbiGii toxin family protein [Micrococcales bacterium]|nr:nucleotidyl transferase AbiEii/AbiGii toxin family protein [Micrococcales bacterium]